MINILEHLQLIKYIPENWKKKIMYCHPGNIP